MKNVKFILPVMVFVMAIGISFASIGLEKEVQIDQHMLTASNACEDIPEVCDNTGTQDCQVQSAEFGGPYEVYENGTCSGVPLKNSNPNIIPVP